LKPVFSVLAMLLAVAVARPALAQMRADPAMAADAEKAFAADALALGDKRAFQKWAAPDGLVFAPDPVNAQQNLAKEPDDKGEPSLVWWPRWAGMSRSGDLGFTTGPFSYDGQLRGTYFTVWARQPDGGLKWIFDGSLATDPNGEPGPMSHADYLDMADAGSGSAEAALKEVAELEAAVARRALSSTRVALLREMADDGRIAGSASPPATRRAAFELELATRPDRMQLTSLGARASSAGDMVFTWGEARSEGGRAHYVRIWQKRAAGWKLVFDGLMPLRSNGAG
jgi:ketosteroid isomerase-like protein